MKYSLNRDGYPHVSICHNGKRKSEKIHRIVAELFIPNPDKKPCVNHINGDKTDNRVENLEWVTYSENNLHAYKAGLMENARKVVGDNGRIHLVKMQSKKVIDTNDGTIYDSAKKAAETNGINHTTLCHWLSGYRKNPTSFKYL